MGADLRKDTGSFRTSWVHCRHIRVGFSLASRKVKDTDGGGTRLWPVWAYCWGQHTSAPGLQPDQGWEHQGLRLYLSSMATVCCKHSKLNSSKGSFSGIFTLASAGKHGLWEQVRQVSLVRFILLPVQMNWVKNLHVANVWRYSWEPSLVSWRVGPGQKNTVFVCLKK